MLIRLSKLTRFVCLWAVAAVAFSLVARAQPPGSSMVIAENGPFRLVSTSQVAPSGLLAATISLETTNINHHVVTLDNVAITGDVHQIWNSLFASPTSFPETVVESPLFNARWASADTHLLIEQAMVGGVAGGGYVSTFETNDDSDPSQIESRLPLSTAGFPPSAGIGALQSGHPTDAFFLDIPFQTNYVDFAYIVTPLTDPPGAVSLTLGVQGSDEMNLPIGPVDFDVTLSPQNFAPPCDFDSDYRCALADLDALLEAVGTDEERFNLELSPLPIDLGDVDRWLEITGVAILGEPYVRGDTDLDGDVDPADLNRLGLNWQIDDAISWGQGDFNADSRVDAADLNALGVNWQHGVDPIAAVGVPEPLSGGLIRVGWFFCLLIWPRPRRATRCRKTGKQNEVLE